MRISKQKSKEIRSQLQEMIGLPVTPDEIQKFNQTYNKFVSLYKMNGTMPVSMAKEFNKLLAQETDA